MSPRKAAAPKPPAVVETPLGDLRPAPWNPRIVSDERFENLCRSIEADPEFLQLRPVLAQKDGTIYAGNQRFRAAEHLGLLTIPAVVEDVPDGLARERALRDNAQWGEWEDSELAIILKELESDGTDIDLLGFDERELQKVLRALATEEGLVDPDDVPELVADPYVQRGEVYVLGDHRLMCGDATDAEDVERLLAGEKPALMVTDPPYGVEYDPTWRSENRIGTVPNDDRADWEAAYALAPGDVAYIWHASAHVVAVAAAIDACGYERRAYLIWAKQAHTFGRGHYHWQHEPLWYAVRKGATAHWIGDRSQSTLWEIENVHPTLGTTDDGETVHGTQKPVECMERPLRNHEGDVYDPFVGSGTTIIAAERQRRRCFAMDIDPAYTQVAIERWERFTGKAAERVRAQS